MNLVELRSRSELETCFSVLKELREDLDLEKFLRLYEAARDESGYRIVAAFSDGACAGLMGYRILTDFVHGRHLYIDDLVVTASRRSSGLGAQLLKHAEDLARENGCEGLRLCTGVQNDRGIRFYEREGWKARAYAFKKKL